MAQYQQYPIIQDHGGFSGQELVLYDKPTGNPFTPYITVRSTVSELLASGAGAYLPLAGGTMTGSLLLAGAPTNSLEAANKAYVDATVGTLGNLSTLNAGAGLTISGTELIVSQISTGDLMANITGSTATPVGVTFSAFVDSVAGSAQGSIIYRNASGWTVLTPGSSGFVLTTAGAAANPSWQAVGTPTGWPGGLALGLTATGTNQATALSLTAGYNVFTTTAAGTGALVTNSTSYPCIVVNKGANALTLYPRSGGAIDSFGTNIGVTLPALYGRAEFITGNLTQWYSS